MQDKKRYPLLHPLGFENGKPYPTPKLEELPDISGSTKGEAFPKIENTNMGRMIQQIKPFKEK